MSELDKFTVLAEDVGRKIQCRWVYAVSTVENFKAQPEKSVYPSKNHTISYPLQISFNGQWKIAASVKDQKKLHFAILPKEET